MNFNKTQLNSLVTIIMTRYLALSVPYTVQLIVRQIVHRLCILVLPTRNTRFTAHILQLIVSQFVQLIFIVDSTLYSQQDVSLKSINLLYWSLMLIRTSTRRITRCTTIPYTLCLWKRIKVEKSVVYGFLRSLLQYCSIVKSNILPCLKYSRNQRIVLHKLVGNIVIWTNARNNVTRSEYCWNSRARVLFRFPIKQKYFGKQLPN
jgi:hypothetical protein